jgi:hypothetical protein
VASERPHAPAGLGAPGKRLWAEMHKDLPAGWALDSREKVLLEAACRCRDELAQLDKVIVRDGVTTETSPLARSENSG